MISDMFYVQCVFLSSVCDSDKLNKESVQMIETGLFSLCLDSPVMRISDEKYVTHTGLHNIRQTQKYQSVDCGGWRESLFCHVNIRILKVFDLKIHSLSPDLGETDY